MIEQQLPQTNEKCYSVPQCPMWLFLPLFYVSKHTPFNSGKKAERRARRDSRHDKTDRQTPGDENSDAVLHHCVGQGEQVESLPPSQVVWVANNWGPPRPRAGRILLCAADSCTQHALPRRDWRWDIYYINKRVLKEITTFAERV